MTVFRKAPNLLCSLVAREAVKEVVKWELTSYLEPLPSSQRCEDDKSESNNGDSDTDILEDVETDGTPSKIISQVDCVNCLNMAILVISFTNACNFFSGLNLNQASV